MREHEPSPCCGTAAPQDTVAPGAGETFRAVLISPYDIGRQPFALAQAAAWLRSHGVPVECADLSVQSLPEEAIRRAQLVAVHVGMHTATRIACELLPKIRALAPHAHLCVFGLYAPMNQAWLRRLGAQTIFGGESEPDLLELAEGLRDGSRDPAVQVSHVHTGKIRFLTPDRSGLPELQRYAHLILPDGSRRTVGFVDATRGCKHLCRHCPVVPVYKGRFRTVPVDVVMADIRQQVMAGAEHISFGDPDFLNGPTHARRIVRALHEEFPDLTYDATIKIQHLLDYADALPDLQRTGCTFITAAVESIDDRVLGYLAKNHTRADVVRAVELLRGLGIDLAPTFIPFTPWTRLEDYRDLLAFLVEHRLALSVTPVQLTIRLLVPQGSHLLELPGFEQRLEAFDPKLLGYPWRNSDARVDALQRQVQRAVMQLEADGRDRGAIFAELWRLAHDALGEPAPALADGALGRPVPYLSEPWYCCAEPTDAML